MAPRRRAISCRWQISAGRPAESWDRRQPGRPAWPATAVPSGQVLPREPQHQVADVLAPLDAPVQHRKGARPRDQRIPRAPLHVSSGQAPSDILDRLRPAWHVPDAWPGSQRSAEHPARWHRFSAPTSHAGASAKSVRLAPPVSGAAAIAIAVSATRPITARATAWRENQLSLSMTSTESPAANPGVTVTCSSKPGWPQ
jgi:hypothetical protein